MSEYKPRSPFIVPIKLLAPSYKIVKGVSKKAYPADGPLIWCSFKTYGGTERTVNDLYSIEDTANIECFYRPDVKSDCRIMLAETGAVYDVINEPEDIELRHKYCKFKVRRIKGGA